MTMTITLMTLSPPMSSVTRPQVTTTVTLTIITISAIAKVAKRILHLKLIDVAQLILEPIKV